MDLSQGLVERAYLDAVATVHPDLCPPLEALFTIHIPFQDTGLVRDIVAFYSHIPIRNGLGGDSYLRISYIPGRIP